MFVFNLAIAVIEKKKKGCKFTHRSCKIAIPFMHSGSYYENMISKENINCPNVILSIGIAMQCPSIREPHTRLLLNANLSRMLTLSTVSLLHIKNMY